MASHAEPSEKQPKRRILLVEDHESTGEVLQRLLRRAGYHVRFVTSLAEVRAAVQEESFDLLISDLHLGDGTGLDVLSAVRRLFEIPAIVLSGTADTSQLSSEELSGFSKCLVKPADWEELNSSVQEFLKPASH
jgi:two-component system response regulator PilR (NtrC family)